MSGDDSMVIGAAAGGTQTQQAADAYLARIVHGSGGGILGVDGDGTIRSWNAAAERMFGYTPAEAVGRPLALLVPPGHAAEQRALMSRLQLGHEASLETVCITKDGRAVHVRLDAAPVLDATGRLMIIAVTFNHITDRRRADDAKAFLASIVESSEDSIMSVNLDLAITSWNKAAERLYGYPAEDVLGKPLTMLTLPDDLHDVLQHIDTVRHSMDVKTFDSVRVHKNGQSIELSVVLSPVKNAVGQVIGVSTIARDITEHNRTEAALRESETELRSLMESIPQIVWVTRPDGWHVHFNQRWLDYTGLTLEASLGHGWIPPFHPDDRARAAKRWQEATQSGEAYEIEYRLRRADGIYHWMLGRALPLRNATGAIVKWFGTCTDIHDLKQAEAVLRESEARYRTLFENFPNGSVFLFDQDLRYTVASGVGLAASGLSPDMFEGKTIWEIFPPEVARRDEPILRAALLGETTRVEVPFGASTFLVHTLPVKDERDHIVGGMVMTQDITERKRAEEHLRFLAEASAILGASLDSDTTLQNMARLAVPLLGDMCLVYIVNSEGMIQQRAAVHVDPAWEEQPRGQPDDCLIDPAGPHAVARALRSGQPVSHTTATNRSQQDTEARWSTDAFIPQAHVIMPLAAHGQVLGAIVFGWSDPDRSYTVGELQLAGELTRRASQAVEQSRLFHEAQAALGTRDEFLSIAAHELKTPLTSIRGYADILLRGSARGQPAVRSDREQRMLRVIAEQTERLEHQINTLLDLSQIGSNRLSLELRLLDVCRFVDRIVDDIQPTLGRHQVLCSCETSPLIIRGDAGRLEQVMQNLLQNAIKYSPEGGTITVHVARREPEVAIAVADQGIGIPLEAQANLFERFYRAPNAASQGIRGLGIGLAVVIDIVARHGGRVEVTSVEGQGSTFTVLLPEDHARLEPDLAAADS